MEQWEFDSYGYIEMYIGRAKLARASYPDKLPTEKPIGVVASFFGTDDGVDRLEKDIQASLAGHNAIIFAVPKALYAALEPRVRVHRTDIKAQGFSEDLIQILDQTNDNYYRMLRKRADLSISEEGELVFPVKEAVTENTQVILDADTDLEEAVPVILESRKAENATSVHAVQSVFVPRSILVQFKKVAEAHHAYYMWNTIEGSLVRQLLFSNAGQIATTRRDGKLDEAADPKSVGHFNQNVYGKSVSWISEQLYLKTMPDDEVLLIPENGLGAMDLLAKEKFCPVICVYPYDDVDVAMAIAKENLYHAGQKPGCGIWSKNDALIKRAFFRLPAVKMSVDRLPNDDDLAEPPTRDRLSWKQK